MPGYVPASHLPSSSSRTSPQLGQITSLYDRARVCEQLAHSRHVTAPRPAVKSVTTTSPSVSLRICCMLFCISCSKADFLHCAVSLLIMPYVIASHLSFNLLQTLHSCNACSAISCQAVFLQYSKVYGTIFNCMIKLKYIECFIMLLLAVVKM